MKKISIAADDGTTVVLLKGLLEGNGYSILAVGDGQKALDAVPVFRPDLVLMDVMLPEVHGYSVCGSIKNDASLNGVKVVFLTSKASQTDRRMAEQVGADGFLVKPVDPAHFLEFIRRYLNT
ncbi:MAG: response regulator [Elusimicrobiota bacterium]|jgi:CheY-like chemotaxis protein